jgi:hypothetical protein
MARADSIRHARLAEFSAARGSASLSAYGTHGVETVRSACQDHRVPHRYYWQLAVSFEALAVGVHQACGPVALGTRAYERVVLPAPRLKRT